MSRALVALRILLSRRVETWYILPLTAAFSLVSGLLAGIVPNALQQRANFYLLGFSVIFGVLGFKDVFSLAMAVGITRRDYVIGSFLYQVQQAIYATILMVGLMVLEKTTGGGSWDSKTSS